MNLTLGGQTLMNIVHGPTSMTPTSRWMESMSWYRTSRGVMIEPHTPAVIFQNYSDPFSPNHKTRNYPQIFVSKDILQGFHQEDHVNPFFKLVFLHETMLMIKTIYPIKVALPTFLSKIFLLVFYTIIMSDPHVLCLFWYPPSLSLFLSVVKYGTASSTAVLLISSSNIWTLFRLDLADAPWCNVRLFFFVTNRISLPNCSCSVCLT